MNKKLTLFTGVIVAVVVFGAVGWLKSYTGQAVNVIENVENFYSNVSEQVVEVADEAALGIVEFFSGKVTYNQLASNVLQERIVRVSPEQVASIAFNPVELLPAPGAGFVYDIQSILGVRVFSSESFNFSSSGGDDREGFEVKWGGCCLTASGLNGAFALGASFSPGFTSGNATNSRTSPSFEIWTPSQDFLIDDDGLGGVASKQYEPVRYASASSVLLTASTTFDATTRTAVADGENQTTFFFRVIYRLVNLNF